MFDDDADDGLEGPESFEGDAAGDDERPAVFVIDGNGIVRFDSIGTQQWQIATNDTVLAVVEEKVISLGDGKTVVPYRFLPDTGSVAILLSPPDARSRKMVARCPRANENMSKSDEPDGSFA